MPDDWITPDSGPLGPYDEVIRREADARGLRPEVLAAQIQVESSGIPTARASTSSARGLTQMTRGAAADVGADWNSLDQPEVSIPAGAEYLARLVNRFGEHEGLRRYYAGPNATDSRRLAEGDAYANKVLSRAGPMRVAAAAPTAIAAPVNDWAPPAADDWGPPVDDWGPPVDAGDGPGAFSRAMWTTLLDENPTQLAETLEMLHYATGSESMKSASDWVRSVAGVPEKYKPQGKGLAAFTSSFGDAMTQIGEWAGQAVGSAAPTLGAALIGGTAGTAVAGPVGGLVGAYAGAFSVSAVLNGGDIYKSLKDEGLPPEQAWKWAMAATGPVAALDMYNPAKLADKALGGAEDEAVKEFAKRLAAVAKEVGKGAKTEAITEGVQQALQEGTVAAATGKDFLTPERIQSIAEAAAAGGVGGVLFGAGSATIDAAKRKPVVEPPPPPPDATGTVPGADAAGTAQGAPVPPGGARQGPLDRPFGVDLNNDTGEIGVTGPDGAFVMTGLDSMAAAEAQAVALNAQAWQRRQQEAAPEVPKPTLGLDAIATARQEFDAAKARQQETGQTQPGWDATPPAGEKPVPGGAMPGAAPEPVTRSVIDDMMAAEADRRAAAAARPAVAPVPLPAAPVLAPAPAPAAPAVDVPPKKVRKASVKGMPKWLDPVKAQRMADLGYDGRTQVAQMSKAKIDQIIKAADIEAAKPAAPAPVEANAPLPMPKQPERLIEFLKRKGGIRSRDNNGVLTSDGGDLLRIVDKAKRGPGKGLVRNTRKALDFDPATDLAWQSGFLGPKDGPRPTPEHLKEAIRKELAGDAVHSLDDTSEELNLRDAKRSEKYAAGETMALDAVRKAAAEYGLTLTPEVERAAAIDVAANERDPADAISDAAEREAMAAIEDQATRDDTPNEFQTAIAPHEELAPRDGAGFEAEGGEATESDARRADEEQDAGEYPGMESPPQGFNEGDGLTEFSVSAVKRTKATKDNPRGIKVVNLGVVRAENLAKANLKAFDLWPEHYDWKQGNGGFSVRAVQKGMAATQDDMFGGAPKSDKPKAGAKPQADLFGGNTTPATQAQAKRDQQGSGGIAPKVAQKDATEGLFAPKESQTGDMLADVTPPAASRVKPIGEQGPGVGNRLKTSTVGGIPLFNLAGALRAYFAGKKTPGVIADMHLAAGQFVLDRGIASGHESAVVIDLKTGDVIEAATSHEPRFNGISEKFQDAINTDGVNVVYHHNHPSGSSFSGADLDFGVARLGAAGIVAWGHDGSFYAARATSLLRALVAKHGDSASLAVRNLWSMMHASPALHIAGLVQSGALTSKDAGKAYNHIIMQALEAVGLVDYVSNVDVTKLIPLDVAAVTFSDLVFEVQEKAGDQLGLNRGKKDVRTYRPTGTVRPAEGIARLFGEGASDGSTQSDGSEIAGRGQDGGGEPSDGDGGGKRTPGFAEPPERGALDPDRPTARPEGRDEIDQTARELAGEAGGKGPGAKNMAPYQRWLSHMADALPMYNVNVFQKFTLMPATLAKLDVMFGRLWVSFKRNILEKTQSNLNELRTHIQSMYHASAETRRQAHAATELNSIKIARLKELRDAGEIGTKDYEFEMAKLVPKPGQEVRVTNTEYAGLEHSKIGDDYVLTPEATKLYHELRALDKAQWRMMMKATAAKFGWKGSLDPEKVAIAAKQATGPQRKNLARIATLLHHMQRQEHEVYFPRFRQGDYYVVLKPKPGVDQESLGGYPDVKWYDLAKSLSTVDDVLGGKFPPGRAAPKNVMPTIERAQKFMPGKWRFNKKTGNYESDTHLIEHGFVSRRPDMLRELNIPAIEKLFMLMENKAKPELVNQIMQGQGAAPVTKAQANAIAGKTYRETIGAAKEVMLDAIYNDLRSGFKKQAKIIPGYDPDFDKAIASHMLQVAKHSADLEGRDEVDANYLDLMENHKHARTRDQAQRWMKAQDDPESFWGHVASNVGQYGAAYVLAMNPANSVIDVLMNPGVATTYLGSSIGTVRAMKFMGPALTHAWSKFSGDTTQGMFIKGPLGNTAAERAAWARANDDGLMSAHGQRDMSGIFDRTADVFGGASKIMRRAFDISMSNLSVADQANRGAIFLAYYRAAEQHMGEMTKAFGNDGKFRAMVEQDGLSPETVARYGLSEAAYEWGKANRSRAMQTPLGQLMFQLHGYQIRFLSAAWNMARHQGPAGRLALTWMMAGLFMGVGAAGLPFVQDVENMIDNLYKFFTKKDPMIAYRIQALLADHGLGKVGADAIINGPLSVASGIYIGSKGGFGDTLSREFRNLSGGTELMGTIPSVIIGRGNAIMKHLTSTPSQGAAAAADLLPNSARNLAMGVIESQKGVRTQAGKMMVPASKLSWWDSFIRAGGGRSMQVERQYQWGAQGNYGYRAPRAKMPPPRNVNPNND